MMKIAANRPHFDLRVAECEAHDRDERRRAALAKRADAALKSSYSFLSPGPDWRHPDDAPAPNP